MARPFLVAALVEQGSPRPVLPEETFFSCWRTWHGGHRPTILKGGNKVIDRNDWP